MGAASPPSSPSAWLDGGWDSARGACGCAGPTFSREHASPPYLKEKGGDGILASSLQDAAAGVLTPKTSWRRRWRPPVRVV
jgi:hypothetical protein